MVKKKVTIELVTKGFKKATAQMRAFSKVMGASPKELQKMTNKSGDLNQKVVKNGKGFGQLGHTMRKVSFRSTAIGKGFAKIGGVFGNVMHSARRLRMEFLGVMFLGMMIQKTFQGLIAPALQMTGAKELLSTVLGLMFLPLGLALIDFAIGLLEWWNALDDETQALINRIVLFGLAIGTILMVVGQLALGIASLVFLFIGLVVPIWLAITAMNALGLIPDSWIAKFEAVKTKVGELWAKFINWAPVKTALESLGINIERLADDPIAYVMEELGKLWDLFVGEKVDSVTETIDGITESMTTLGETFAKYYSNAKAFVDQLLKIPATLLLAAIGGISGGVGGMIAGAGVGAVIDTRRIGKEIETGSTLSEEGFRVEGRTYAEEVWKKLLEKGLFSNTGGMGVGYTSPLDGLILKIIMPNGMEQSADFIVDETNRIGSRTETP